MTSKYHQLVTLVLAFLILVFAAFPLCVVLGTRVSADGNTVGMDDAIPLVRLTADSTDDAQINLIHGLGATVDITVAPGGDLQAAINKVLLGDNIIVQAGAIYIGPYTLPVKSGEGVITIQSSRVAELPVNIRITPSQSALLAKLQSNTPAEPVIKTAAGAHGYKFIGVEISTTSTSVVVYDLVRFGDGRTTQNTLDSVPRALSIDRSWIHGFSDQEVQRGVSMQAADDEVTNSYISDVHMIGIEAQAIAGWNGPGPHRIINNRLEGSTQGILFGGADPASEAFIPSNISIIGNHLFKPLSWKVGDPSYAGKHWTVKNIIEFKDAKNVNVTGNLFENNWTDGQDGTAFLLTVRNQECTAPYSTIQNVNITYNIVRNAEGAFNFLGKDNEADLAFGKCKDAAKAGSVRGSGVALRHNVVDNINGKFLVLNGFNGVTVERTTHIQKFNTMELYGEQSAQFVYRDNVTSEENYGIHGDGGTQGQSALDKFTPGAVVTGNVVAHPYQPWPAGNQIVPALVIDTNYRTPYTNKGADMDQLTAAQSGSIVSVPSPSPTPAVSPSLSPTPFPSPAATPTPVGTPTPTPSPSPSPTPTLTLTGDWLWPSRIADQRILRETVRQNGWHNCQVWNGRYWCEK